jgi:hypothetical protein
MFGLGMVHLLGANAGPAGYRPPEHALPRMFARLLIRHDQENVVLGHGAHGTARVSAE